MVLNKAATSWKGVAGETKLFLNSLTMFLVKQSRNADPNKFIIHNRKPLICFVI